MTDTTDAVDYTDILPFDDPSDALGGVQPRTLPRTLGEAPFLYLGIPLTASEFSSYVETYNFGPIKPDFIVFHHTAVPSASWAPHPNDNGSWDQHEAGLTVDELKAKRRRQLNGIKNFYQTKYGWDRGPHLFIDDQFIWLFTPMAEIGIHAAEGNSNHHGNRLHYSIGIEMVGYHEHVTWNAGAATLAGLAVAVLKRKLGTFELVYGPNEGKIGSHRLYNKPSCPGSAITDDYMIRTVQRGWAALSSVSPGSRIDPALPPGTYPVAPQFQASWNASGGVWQAGKLTPGYALSGAFASDQKLYQLFERGVARFDANGVAWLRADEWPAIMETYKRLGNLIK